MSGYFILIFGMLVFALVMSTLVLFVIVGGALLARRNLRMGRGDRRGALRLAAIALVLRMVTWATKAHHVEPMADIELWIRALAWALLWSVAIWIFYIALEPYLRRMWPESLISWNRLLGGRVRDPRVGRDVLVGATAGAVMISLDNLHWLGTEWFSFPTPHIDYGMYNAVLGTFRSLAAILTWLNGAAMFSIFFLLAILIVRLIVKKQWAAMLIMLAVFVFVGGGSDAWIWSIPAGLLRITFNVVTGLILFGIASRFGLLAMIAMFWFYNLRRMPLTPDLSLWFAGNAWLVAVLMLAVAAYAAYLAAAGRPLFRDPLLDG